MKKKCALLVLCIMFLVGCSEQNEELSKPIIENNTGTESSIIIEEETPENKDIQAEVQTMKEKDTLSPNGTSITWQEAYSTYIHDEIDLQLDGMTQSVAAFTDEFIPLEQFKVNALDLNADSIPELILSDEYNSIWVLAFDTLSEEVYCVCEHICRPALFAGDNSFTCEESPTGGMYYYQEYDMKNGRFTAGSTCSSDQLDPSTGAWLDAPVLSASDYGDDLDIETYEKAQREMNILKEIDWWSTATLLSETTFS